jgi:hypothetical protein
MLPHSVTLLFSQWWLTGFVKKSLHPAARAFTLSLLSDEAVCATMITEERYGDAPVAVYADAALSEDEGSENGEAGGYPSAAFSFSRRRISLVASIPSMTGI